MVGEEIKEIFNTKKEPMSDLKFRKALAYAINKDLVRMIAYFYSTTVGTYNTGILQSLSGKWLSKDFYKRMTSYDYSLETAHKILDEAGYKKDNDGFYKMPGGEAIQLEIASIAQYSDWVLACESLNRA